MRLLSLDLLLQQPCPHRPRPRRASPRPRRDHPGARRPAPARWRGPHPAARARRAVPRPRSAPTRGPPRPGRDRRAARESSELSWSRSRSSSPCTEDSSSSSDSTRAASVIARDSSSERLVSCCSKSARSCSSSPRSSLWIGSSRAWAAVAACTRDSASARRPRIVASAAERSCSSARSASTVSAETSASGAPGSPGSPVGSGRGTLWSSSIRIVCPPSRDISQLGRAKVPDHAPGRSSSGRRGCGIEGKRCSRPSVSTTSSACATSRVRSSSQRAAIRMMKRERLSGRRSTVSMVTAAGGSAGVVSSVAVIAQGDAIRSVAGTPGIGAPIAWTEVSCGAAGAGRRSRRPR